MVVTIIFYGNYIYSKLNYEKFSIESQCNYLPWGPTLDACITNCVSRDRIGLWDIDGNQCSKTSCEYLCQSCDNKNLCQWLSTWENYDYENLLNTGLPEDSLSKLVPGKLNISGISYPDDEDTEAEKSVIEVRWNNDDTITTYMIHVFDMKSNENKISVSTVDNTDDTTSSNKWIMRNISKNSSYAIIVYGINEYGISDSSNILTIET